MLKDQADKGQDRPTQSLSPGVNRWSGSCYLRGRRSNRGFTLIELMIAMSVAGILAAVAVPVFVESSARNSVWTASELIGAHSGTFAMPVAVGYGDVDTMEVNGRGVYSSTGGAIPQVIRVTYGARSRSLTVTATGQITFESF